MAGILGIGVIGVGRLGFHHARNIRRSEGAVLAAVSDPFPEARARAEKEFGVQGYSSYGDLIADPKVDALVIATPTQTHYEVLTAAVSGKKPIFCEKPITYTLEEAEKIVEMIEGNGVFLQIGFMRRFDPGYAAAKRMIEGGECGKPIYIHDCQRDPNGPPPEYVPQSGGIFVDMAIHDLDVARWLMDSEVTEIYARGAVLKHGYLKDLDDIDEGQILLKFAGGALGMIEISRNANGVYDTRTEVVGLEKSVFVGQNQLTPYTVVGGGRIVVDMANWCLGRFKEGYELEMRAFIDAVRGNKPSPVTAYDGLVGLKLALAATESWRKAEPIKLTYPAGKSG
ncbi:MAG: Gfo/Idh/MocA family oxidoreductase [Planctomycetota bacterium]|jgi:scyllo-inositol 2-dehydrogenase (NAD+)|nr:Gfo/Idh/MocA family oxidoreductase [Planctomycetota bacterium]